MLLHYAGVAQGRSEAALRAALYGALGWVVVTAGVLFLGLARPPGRRGSRALRLGLAAVVPVAFFVYLAFAGSGRLPFGEFVGEHAGWAVGCGLIATFFGALVRGQHVVHLARNGSADTGPIRGARGHGRRNGERVCDGMRL